MSRIKIENCFYKIHPVYDMYATSKDGKIISINRKNPMDGCKSNTGYMLINVRKKSNIKEKMYNVHRFVYECYEE